jgi:hypothetical protein
MTGSRSVGRVTLDPFAPPPPLPRGDRAAAAAGRWREDVPRALAVLVWSVLLGAPAGLLWSQVAPRLRVTVTDKGLDYPDLEGTKAFIGADGTYVLVMLGAGLLCGLVGWLAARKAGPWTVTALAVGGFLAALVAARVGLQPGSHEALAALAPGSSFRGTVKLFLGVKHDGDLHLRAGAAAALAWPVGAMASFLAAAGYRPQDLD